MGPILLDFGEWRGISCNDPPGLQKNINRYSTLLHRARLVRTSRKIEGRRLFSQYFKTVNVRQGVLLGEADRPAYICYIPLTTSHHSPPRRIRSTPATVPCSRAY